MRETLSKLSRHQEAPVGTKIVRNVAFGGLRVLLVTPVPLLLTPFIIHKVGTQGLGIWAVFIAINNLTSLADLGFLGTLTKHISEHFTRKDYLQLNRTLNSGLIMFLGISALCVCAMIFGSGLITSAFFQRAPVSWIQLQHAVRWLSLAVGLNLLAFPFASITMGLQRLDFTSLLSAINLIATALLVALFLASGSGIMGLAYAILAAAALNLLLQIAVAKYLLPEFETSLKFIRMSDIKSLFSFSLQIYVTQVAIAVHAHTEKFLLAHFSGLSAAGFYDVANDLATKTRNLPALLLAPLLPATTELEARQDELRTTELYYRVQKYLAFLGLPIIVFMAVISRRFVELWLGPGFSAAAIALAVLTGVHIFNLTSGPGALLLTSKGILWPAVRSSVLGIMGNVLLSTFLVIRFGFKGAVYGTSVSLIAATAYFLFLFHRETGYSVTRLLKQSLKPLLCGSLSAIPTGAFVSLFAPRWLGLSFLGLAYVMLYCAGLLVTRFFDPFDLHAVERFVPIPKVVRRILLFA